MEETVKAVVAKFLRIEPDSISDGTRLDKKALQSSILVHRFYAALAENGVRVINYHDIDTYGELIKRLNGASPNKEFSEIEELSTSHGKAQKGIGIDIELVRNMPTTNDYRGDSFYNMNFSPREISHCVLQANPRISFAGLFAVKEAIIKSDPGLVHRSLFELEIDHDSAGKPIKEGFHLSISHVDEVAIAVAVPEMVENPYDGGSSKEQISRITLQIGELRRDLRVYKFLFWMMFLAVIGLVLLFSFR